MIRLFFIASFCGLLAVAWAPVQASPLNIVYSANTFGAYFPCPS